MDQYEMAPQTKQKQFAAHVKAMNHFTNPNYQKVNHLNQPNNFDLIAIVLQKIDLDKNEFVRILQDKERDRSQLQ